MLILIALILISVIAGMMQYQAVNGVNPILAKIIRHHISQSSRWAIASLSDNNAFISNLHANYGSSYLMALRGVASDSQIKKVTGLDVLKLERHVSSIQRKAAKKLFNVCKNIIPMEDPYLTSISQLEY